LVVPAGVAVAPEVGCGRVGVAEAGGELGDGSTRGVTVTGFLFRCGPRLLTIGSRYFDRDRDSFDDAALMILMGDLNGLGAKQRIVLNTASKANC
jgi:hypothetical protein